MAVGTDGHLFRFFNPSPVAGWGATRSRWLENCSFGLGLAFFYRDGGDCGFFRGEPGLAVVDAAAAVERPALWQPGLFVMYGVVLPLSAYHSRFFNQSATAIFTCMADSYLLRRLADCADGAQIWEEFYALNGGPRFKFTEAISLFVNGETQEEVDELWEKLSAGGEKSQCGR